MSDELAGTRWADRLRSLPQYMVPQHSLTALVHAATRWQFKAWRRLLIGWFVRHYAVDLREAECSDTDAYQSFNAFFTRALRADARPIIPDASKVLCPIDGTVSQVGQLTGDRLLQAKGKVYSVVALLGDTVEARQFSDGSYATLYLSPRDYHRVHMPVDAELAYTRYIPGRLFSVNARSTRAIDQLFARNERLVCRFNTQYGPMMLIMVGALCVAAMETVWSGLISEPGLRERSDIRLAQGAEMGRFNMGSTVILLFPAGKIRWFEAISEAGAVHVGLPIGEYINR
jgi:phosphatidylserine decarboxylase